MRVFAAAARTHDQQGKHDCLRRVSVQSEISKKMTPHTLMGGSCQTETRQRCSVGGQTGMTYRIKEDVERIRANGVCDDEREQERTIQCRCEEMVC